MGARSETWNSKQDAEYDEWEVEIKAYHKYLKKRIKRAGINLKEAGYKEIKIACSYENGWKETDNLLSFIPNRVTLQQDDFGKLTRLGFQGIHPREENFKYGREQVMDSFRYRLREKRKNAKGSTYRNQRAKGLWQLRKMQRERGSDWRNEKAKEKNYYRKLGRIRLEEDLLKFYKESMI